MEPNDAPFAHPSTWLSLTVVAALGCAGPADSAVQEVVTMAQQTTYFATNLKALYLLLPLGRYNPQGGS